jgi:hypothetical protein
MDIDRASREIIKVSAKEGLGYYELKQHKPWFDGGCSKLCTSKSPSNPSTYSTRMIFPIRIRNSTINPQQTGRSNCPCHINCKPIHLTNTKIKIQRNTILPSKPNYILINNQYSNSTNMNRGTTRGRSIHPNRTNPNSRILRILHYTPANNKILRHSKQTGNKPNCNGYGSQISGDNLNSIADLKLLDRLGT